ncbi:hypothetical protein PHMEG_00029166 [Phytophthora megakarya]|uniref:Transposase n=1 Tax=Phytophthora megakarya TaxID=4795 RepID=A0A225V4Z2_9STRA|nr:hypothetical protein PHMEG_00029166 [Phytophthora megakarya]
MSWPGAMVQYFETKKEESDRDRCATEHKLYCDHLSLGDNRQDRDAVISVLEAVLIRLRKDLPTVKTVTLISNNTNYYQNALLPLIVPFLLHGIHIKRILHTETQDGRGVLDAHFLVRCKY